jgi:L-lactate dehydrogenase complex protein LldE
MPRVALAAPCYMTLLRPEDTEHAARVLRALGDEVALLDGVCCGQPAFNSGHPQEARTVGREFLRAAQDDAIVLMPSASCVSMVQHYLPTLFEGSRREGASRIASRVREFTEYVANHPNLPALPLRLSGAVAYHDSCHARRELGLTETVLGLLESIEGLDVRRLQFEAECCGFGGTFSVKQPETSAEMRAGKRADAAATGARVLVSTDLSCLAHISAAKDGHTLDTWTVAELLSRALPDGAKA